MRGRMKAKRGSENEEEDGAEGKLEAEPATGEGGVAAPERRDLLFSAQDDVEAGELQPGSDVEEEEHEGAGEEREEGQQDVEQSCFGARAVRMRQQRRQRRGQEDAAREGEVGGGGELPGAAELEGLEEDGLGALKCGRDGFSGGERAHKGVR